MPSAASNAQPLFAWHTVLATALPVSQEDAQHASLPKRAGNVALIVVDPGPLKGRCASGDYLSFGARPWCDVPAAAFILRIRLPRDTRACATALPVSREDAEHAILPRARAMPRWLWSIHAR